MNNIRKYTAWLGAGAIMITLATGCADKNNNGQPDSMATTNEVAGTTDNMVDAAGNNLAETGDAMGNTMDNAGTAIANGAETAADATGNVASAAGSNLEALGDAATYTPKIKTALGANAALKGSEINVDTLGEKNTIALRGTVTSQAQKDLAGSIAKQNAPGYTIANQLTMKGAM